MRLKQRRTESLCLCIEFALAPHRTGSTFYFSNTLGIVRPGITTIASCVCTCSDSDTHTEHNGTNPSCSDHRLESTTTFLACPEAAVLHLRTSKLILECLRPLQQRQQPQPQIGYERQPTKLTTMQQQLQVNKFVYIILHRLSLLVNNLYFMYKCQCPTYINPLNSLVSDWHVNRAHLHVCKQTRPIFYCHPALFTSGWIIGLQSYAQQQQLKCGFLRHFRQAGGDWNSACKKELVWWKALYLCFFGCSDHRDLIAFHAPSIKLPPFCVCPKSFGVHFLEGLLNHSLRE